MAILLIVVKISSYTPEVFSQEPSLFIKICDGIEVEEPLDILADGTLERQFQIEARLMKINVINYTDTFGLLIGTDQGIFQWYSNHLYSCSNWPVFEITKIEANEILVENTPAYYVVIWNNKTSAIYSKSYNDSGELVYEDDEVETSSYGNIWHAESGMWYYDSIDNLLHYFDQNGVYAQFVISLEEQVIDLDFVQFEDRSETWILTQTSNGPKMYAGNMQDGTLEEIPLRMDDGFEFREVNSVAVNSDYAVIGTDIGLAARDLHSEDVSWYMITPNPALSEEYISVDIIDAENLFIGATAERVVITDFSRG